jgi:quercetin dioxygenase-like cupin family protein
MIEGTLYQYVSKLATDTWPDKNPITLTSIMSKKISRYAAKITAVRYRHGFHGSDGRSTTMPNRRVFMSGAMVATIGLALSQGSTVAQTLSKIPLKILKKTEYPGDKYVCVLLSLELQPGEPVPRHMHPGVESSYIVEGGITLFVKGEPARVFKAGEGYQIPPETPHNIINGPEKSTIVATLIVEKDKPLVEPASE